MVPATARKDDAAIVFVGEVEGLRGCRAAGQDQRVAAARAAVEVEGFPERVGQGRGQRIVAERGVDDDLRPRDRGEGNRQRFVAVGEGRPGDPAGAAELLVGVGDDDVAGAVVADGELVVFAGAVGVGDDEVIGSVEGGGDRAGGDEALWCRRLSIGSCPKPRRKGPSAG